MEKVSEFKDIMMQSLNSMWLEITNVFPNIIGALVVFFLGWLITKLVVKIIKKLLKLAKVDKLDEKLNSMGLEVISNQISDLLAYLPQLFSALVIFMIGLLFANFVKKGLKSLFESMDLSGGKMISQVVFFLLLTFISITALNQAGIDTEIISDNINMIIAAFLLAFAIAFGFGAREVVGKLLKTFYARKTFEIGQNIIFNNESYTVESVENISVILKNSKGKLIVPIDDLVENQVKMQDQL
jgi:hypothetical protein